MVAFLETFGQKTFASRTFRTNAFDGGMASGSGSTGIVSGPGSKREAEGYRKEICVTDENGNDVGFLGNSTYNALRVLVASSTTGGLTIFGGVVGGSAVQLLAVSCTQGLVLIADPNNSGTIYVGSSSAVTANAGVSTSGLPLSKGEATPTIPVNSSDLIWVIGSGAGQNYTVLCV